MFLRKIYVSRCKRPCFGGQNTVFWRAKAYLSQAKDICFACRDAACRVKNRFNYLIDNGLGEIEESGKKRRFLSARKRLVDFFQNLRLKFFRRLLKSIEDQPRF